MCILRILLGVNNMGRHYYIFSNGRIKRKENTVYVENENGEKKAIPIEDIETIHIFGELDLNTKLLNFLSQQNKTVHIYNYFIMATIQVVLCRGIGMYQVI